MYLCIKSEHAHDGAPQVGSITESIEHSNIIQAVWGNKYMTIPDDISDKELFKLALQLGVTITR